MPVSFTPYQVDFAAKNASKTFGFSKKRISFKFGIANNEAMAQGLTGAHCRGSEHEVIFVWSLNSGKRQILADGKDVHFSESGQNGWTTDQVFQHHFQIRIPGFSTPLRCHFITQPANRDVPSIKPFDLRVNGLSYFSFSKIFQLGTPQMMSRAMKPSRGSSGGGSRGSSSGGGGQYRQQIPRGGANEEEDPYCTPEERQAIAAAKLASIREMRTQDAGGTSNAGTSMSRDEGNLINLLDAPAPLATAPPRGGQGNNFVSSMTMDTTFGQPPPQQHYQPQPPPPSPAAYGQQPYSNHSLGSSTQQPPQQQPAFVAQPPPAAAYGQPPPVAAYGQPPPQPAFAQPPPQQQQQQPQYANQNAMTPVYGQQQQQAAYYQAPPAQQPPQGFGSPNPLQSPSNETFVSYGSAPSFAQPPQQHQQQPPPQQYQGFPQY